MTIAQRYAALRAQVPAHVTIVAVAKFQPAEAVREAIAAGVTDVGENYVQEARAKFDILRQSITDCRQAQDERCHGELVEPRKHFIGHVQTNKAKAIVNTFDMVQSVDRLEAGAALARAAQALGRRLPILVQVNISPAERFGCAPDQAPALAQALRAFESLQVEGIMAIGPVTQDRREIARAFQSAAALLRRVGGATLSMGMSSDWREAVEAGSTMIRVGSSIFGPRPARAASKSTTTSSP